MTINIKQLLQAKVSVIPVARGKVIVVNSDENVVHGFEKLLDNQILSAPVFDGNTGKYTGFLDIRDLISFCVFIYESNAQADNLIDIVHFGVKMFKHSIDGVTLTYLSRRNPFHAVKEDAPLQEVVDMLARGLRRVPVLNEKDEIVNIVSQSSIIQYLQAHENEISGLDVTIKDINLGTSPVLSVNRNTKAIDVFRVMDHSQRSGVAVVDDSGMLVGNTSGRDLKLFIQTPSISVLDMPIMQFLNQIRNLNIDIMVPVVSLSPEDTLRLAIGKLAATRVHRTFAVDKQYHPTSVISITDVLRYIDAQVKATH